MNPIRVWAPTAKTVAARIGESNIPLDEAPGGWWRLLQPVPPGTDYAVVIDGQSPVPDPRSLQLPYGIHGPSRTVDHTAFEWQDAKWQAPPLSFGIVYELHTGTFSEKGTFDGVIDHLEDLCGLGITHIELMPVNSFSGVRGWGYDGVGLYAPQESYGGPDGMKRLVDACHGRGLAVILDVVYNHLGPEGNYLAHFGPYFADHYTSPWGKAVNLDGPYSFEVRRFFVDNALMWLRDYHVDGLRIDAVHAFMDISAIHFLEEMACAVRRLEAETGRHLVLIAESDLNDPRIVKPVESGGYGLDAQWSDDFHHALHAVLTGEKDGYYSDFGEIGDLARTLERGFAYDGRYSGFRKRIHGRPICGLSGNRFFGYLQNHDQVGNRALGERIGHLAGPDRLKVGAAIVFFAPFVPMLFQGEEWGASTPFMYFTDHQDPDLGEAVRNGRCREFESFGWRPEDVPDPQAVETFEKSILQWKETEREPHRSILKWYRQLITLRKQAPDLKDGRMDRIRTRWDDSARWLLIERGRYLLACNLGEARQLVPIPTEKTGSLVLCSANGIECRADGLLLPPDSAAITHCVC